MSISMSDLERRLKALEKLTQKIADKVGVEADPPKPPAPKRRRRVLNPGING